MVMTLFSCSQAEEVDGTTSDEVTINVASANFLAGGLVSAITTETRSLSDGSTAPCYKIVVKSLATDHSMGPWCPTNISDDKSKGGIWLEGGVAYDVDGAFVKNLATFYKDNTWLMYNATTGVITKTKTQTECQEAANPNVGAAYKNYCVECLPSYVANLTHTYYIPVTPKKASSPISFGTGPMSAGPSVRGLAFNGVVFDAPAPVNNILGAYTLAPFDDAGGHINLAAGYHYHAATGLTAQIAQTDGHAAMIGYALDGYGMYERLDPKGVEATDLDASRGHYDAVRGYHYHVDAAGKNNFINGLRGVYAN
jgi:hypothetical protein